ncbi:PAS domain-containing protein [Blastococcus brunescens]|uniref:PAS domain-containing protein n=1 Tax=Blastococcus brunescens TaxID=1564165 RepID=UPI003BEF37BD
MRFLETMPAAFCFLDAGWRFRYVNAEAERLMGRPRAQLIGESLWEAFPGWSGACSRPTTARQRPPGGPRPSRRPTPAPGTAGSRSGCGPVRTGWPSTSSTSPTGATPRTPRAAPRPVPRCSPASPRSCPASSTPSRHSAGWRSSWCRSWPTPASSRWSTGKDGPATSARGTAIRRDDG